MSDDKREWTPKQLAMELLARGIAHSAYDAAHRVAEFEREWCPVEALIKARSDELYKQLDGAPRDGAPQSERDAWVAQVKQKVVAAGQRAFDDAQKWWPA